MPKTLMVRGFWRRTNEACFVSNQAKSDSVLTKSSGFWLVQKIRAYLLFQASFGKTYVLVPLLVEGPNQQSPTLDTNPETKRVDTEPDIPMLVACRRFGQMFKFRVFDFINENQALITSVLTRESFTVPVEELSLWEGIA